MPNVDFLFGLVCGVFVGRFAVDTLCTERAGDFAFSGGDIESYLTDDGKTAYLVELVEE